MAKDSFQGYDKILLQPGSSAVPYMFTFEACSSTTANDGSIPSGETITDATVSAFDSDGTDVTSELVDSSSFSTTTVTVYLNYPSTSGAGRYHLEILLEMTVSGAILEFDFTRVYAEDITI